MVEATEVPFKRHRIARRLRVEEVAAFAGIGQTTVSKLDRGHVPGPAIRKAVASALHVSEDELFPTVTVR